MAFDGLVIASLVNELNQTITGGRVAKISQPEHDALLFTVKNQKNNYKLLLSASASLPLLYLTTGSYENPVTAPNFCMLLRKHIGNARILSVSQPGLERIIMIHFEHLDELGDLCQKKLIIEIMGKHSNIIFTTTDDTIIDSIKHVPFTVSSVREVLPGRQYFIPDTMNKVSPLTCLENDFIRLFTGNADCAKTIYTTFTGISPCIAEEIVHRAKIDSSRSAESLTDMEKMQLAHQFITVMDETKNGHFSPSIYYQNENPVEFSAITLKGRSECQVEFDSSMSHVLETYYAQQNQISRIRQKSIQLRKTVQNLLERNYKKFDLQQKQLNDTKKREQYKINGELIQAYSHSVPDGAKQVEVINYYTNEPVTISLDPDLSPIDNANRFFERYNKLKRTYEALSEYIQETEEEIAHLESIQMSIELAQSADDLEQIRQELSDCGYTKRIAHTKKGAKRTSRNAPDHYRSSDGFDIYVGKNNFQNDELTFRFADSRDIWMHAKKIPGSHVIIHNLGATIPDRTYEEAASLAAYYSSGRAAGKVEVDYIEKKQVKKPAGAKPGYVIYHTNYSMIATADIRHIQKIQ